MSEPKAYRDYRGWTYRVMSGLDSNGPSWKGRYHKPGGNPQTGWKCMTQLPWRVTRSEAQEDLDELAKQKGWWAV